MHTVSSFELPRMPNIYENAKGAVKWMVGQLLKDIQVAKVLPIKMANMQHQDHLRFLALELEVCRSVLTLFITDAGASTISNILLHLTKGSLCFVWQKTLKAPTSKSKQRMTKWMRILFCIMDVVF